MNGERKFKDMDIVHRKILPSKSFFAIGVDMISRQRFTDRMNWAVDSAQKIAKNIKKINYA
jgi:hypothetical protein